MSSKTNMSPNEVDIDLDANIDANTNTNNQNQSTEASRKSSVHAASSALAKIEADIRKTENKSAHEMTAKDAKVFNAKTLAEMPNIPDWFVTAMVGLDQDGDGNLDRDEMVQAMKFLAKMKEEHDKNSGEIDYTYFPAQVKEVLKVWDNDGSGTVGVHELAAAAKAQEQMNKENRHLKKAVFALIGVITLLIVMNFVMGYLAAEAAKDARPNEDGGHRMLSATSSGEYTNYFGGRSLLARTAEFAAGRYLLTSTPTLLQPLGLSYTEHELTRRLELEEKEISAIQMDLEYKEKYNGRRYLKEYGRSTKLQQYYDKVNSGSGKKKRLLHADPDQKDAQQGALSLTTAPMGDGGTVVGTSSTVDEFLGMEAIDRILAVPPESVGLIVSFNLPGMDGPVKLGPFTELTESVDPYEGFTKAFSGGDITMYMRMPPQYNMTNADGTPGPLCPPEPFIEVQNVKNNHYQIFPKEAIESNGEYYCHGYISPRFCGETQEEYDARVEWMTLDMANMQAPNKPCHTSPTLLLMNGQPQQTAGISHTPVPAITDYCGATAACTFEEYHLFQEAMGIPPNEQLSYDQFLAMNSTGTMDFITMDTKTNIMPFQQIVNVSHNNNPNVINAVHAHEHNYNMTYRRRMQADLLSGNFRIRRRERLQRRLHPDPDSTPFPPDSPPTGYVPLDIPLVKQQVIEQMRAQNPGNFDENIPVQEISNIMKEQFPGNEAIDAILSEQTNENFQNINQEQYEQAVQVIAGTSPKSVSPTFGEAKDKSEGGGCAFFKNDDMKTVKCNKRDAEQFLVGAGKKLKLCRALDANRDGQVTKEECISYNPASPFDSMAQGWAKKNAIKMAKIQEKGVRLRDCVKHKKKLNSWFMARFQCIIHDVHKPFATRDGGLSREEMNMNTKDVLNFYAQAFTDEMHDDEEYENYDPMDYMPRALAAGSDTVFGQLRAQRQRRRLASHKNKISVAKGKSLPMVTRNYRDPLTGKITKSHSHLHPVRGAKNEFHDLLFEQLLNVPRMLKTEAVIEHKERVLRKNMKRSLGEHEYENWILERRLKSLERLRRRRILLAFNEARGDDPEEAHRQLKRTNRRLQQISKAASDKVNRRHLLQAVHRKLKQEDDHHDKSLRRMLHESEEAHTHSITANHKQYVEEFNIKRTSKEMKELMELTHAAKMNVGEHHTSPLAVKHSSAVLGGGPSASSKLRKLMTDAEKEGRSLSEYDVSVAEMVSTAADHLQVISFEEAKQWARAALKEFQKQNKGVKRAKKNLPKLRLLKLLKNKLNEKTGQELLEFLLENRVDDHAQEEKYEAGGLPCTTEFCQYNMDGTTYVDQMSHHYKVRELSQQYRVLQEIGERRRLDILDDDAETDGENRLRKLQEVDEYHRILSDKLAYVNDAMNGQQINLKEGLKMLGGDQQQVQMMGEFCKKESEHMAEKLQATMRRVIRMLKSPEESSKQGVRHLSQSELHELHQARLLAENGGTSGSHQGGPGGPFNFACTPCMVNAFMSATTQAANMLNPIISFEYEQGNPEYCSAAFHNFQAILMDKPGCIPPETAFTPVGPPTYIDPATKQEVIVDINACAGFPIHAQGEVPPGTAPLIDETQAMTAYLGTTNIGRKRGLGEVVEKLERKERRLERQLKDIARGSTDIDDNDHAQPKNMFLHKRKKQLTYREALKVATQQRRMQRNERRLREVERRALKSSKTDKKSNSSSKRKLSPSDVLDNYESLYAFDGSGRILHPDVNTAVCDSAGATPLQRTQCEGTMLAGAQFMPTEETEFNQATSELISKEEVKPVKFIQVAELAMNGGSAKKSNEAPECSELPDLEKKMPISGVTEDFSTDPNNAFAANMKADEMGPGCMKECGCAWIIQLPPPSGSTVPLEGFVNYCTYDQVANCECMKKKRKCHKKIRDIYMKKAGSGMGGGEEFEGGSRQLSVRNRLLKAKKNIRRYRMDNMHYRKLLSYDNKKLVHEIEMKRSRRRHLLINQHGFDSKMVDKIERTEKKLKRALGTRYKSVRLLTGRTGDARRNLAIVEEYHNQKRKLRRQLLGNNGAKQSNSKKLLSNSKDAATVTRKLDHPDDVTLPPNFDLNNYPVASYDSSPASLYFEQNTALMTEAPIANFPALHVDTMPPGTYDYDPTNDGPVELSMIINQGLYDTVTEKMYEVTNIALFEMNEPDAPAITNPTREAPFDHIICIKKLDTTSMAASYAGQDLIEECHPAMKYDPDQMGYSTMLTQEYHHDTIYCPKDDEFSNPQYDTAGNPTNNFMDFTREGNNLMFDTRPGTVCIHGIPQEESMITDQIIAQEGRGNNMGEARFDPELREPTTDDDRVRMGRPKADLILEATRPQEMPSGREMEDSLKRRAELKGADMLCKDVRDREPQYAEFCPAGSAGEDRKTVGQAESEAIEEMFRDRETGTTNAFNPQRVEEFPAIVNDMKDIISRGGPPTADYGEDLMLEQTMKESPPDLGETAFASMPMGDVPYAIDHSDSKAPTLWDKVKDASQDQAQRRELSGADLKNFHDECGKAGNTENSEACATIDNIKTYIFAMNTVPGDERATEAKLGEFLASKFSPSELEGLAERANAYEQPAIVEGQNGMSRGQTRALAAISGEGGARTLDQMSNFHEERSGGRGIVSTEDMSRPSSMVQETKTARGRRNTVESEEERKEIERREERTDNVLQKCRRGATESRNAMTDAVEHARENYERSRLLRARKLAAIRKETFDANEHIPIILEIDLNQRQKWIEKEFKNNEKEKNRRLRKLHINHEHQGTRLLKSVLDSSGTNIRRLMAVGGTLRSLNEYRRRRRNLKQQALPAPGSESGSARALGGPGLQLDYTPRGGGPMETYTFEKQDRNDKGFEYSGAGLTGVADPSEKHRIPETPEEADAEFLSIAFDSEDIGRMSSAVTSHRECLEEVTKELVERKTSSTRPEEREAIDRDMKKIKEHREMIEKDAEVITRKAKSKEGNKMEHARKKQEDFLDKQKTYTGGAGTLDDPYGQSAAIKSTNPLEALYDDIDFTMIGIGMKYDTVTAGTPCAEVDTGATTTTDKACANEIITNGATKDRAIYTFRRDAGTNNCYGVYCARHVELIAGTANDRTGEVNSVMGQLKVNNTEAESFARIMERIPDESMIPKALIREETSISKDEMIEARAQEILAAEGKAEARGPDIMDMPRNTFEEAQHEVEDMIRNLPTYPGGDETERYPDKLVDGVSHGSPSKGAIHATDDCPSEAERTIMVPESQGTSSTTQTNIENNLGMGIAYPSIRMLMKKKVADELIFKKTKLEKRKRELSKRIFGIHDDKVHDRLMKNSHGDEELELLSNRRLARRFGKKRWGMTMLLDTPLIAENGALNYHDTDINGNIKDSTMDRVRRNLMKKIEKRRLLEKSQRRQLQVAVESEDISQPVVMIQDSTAFAQTDAVLNGEVPKAGDTYVMSCGDFRLVTQGKSSAAQASHMDVAVALEEKDSEGQASMEFIKNDVKMASEVSLDSGSCGKDHPNDPMEGPEDPMEAFTDYYAPDPALGMSQLEFDEATAAGEPLPEAALPTPPFDPMMMSNPGYFRNRKMMAKSKKTFKGRKTSMQKLREYYKKNDNKKKNNSKTQVKGKSTNLNAKNVKKPYRTAINMNSRIFKKKPLHDSNINRKLDHPPLETSATDFSSLPVGDIGGYQPKEPDITMPPEYSEQIAGSIETSFGKVASGDNGQINPVTSPAPVDPALMDAAIGSAAIEAIQAAQQAETPAMFTYSGAEYNDSPQMCDGPNFDAVQNYDTGVWECSYIGDDITKINESGDPADHMEPSITTCQENDAKVMESLEGKTEPAKDIESMDMLASQLCSPDGSSCPNSLPESDSCEGESTSSMFAVGMPYTLAEFDAGTVSGLKEYIQIDPQANCKYDKEMQNEAKGLEDAMLPIVDRSAQCKVTANMRKTLLRRALFGGSEGASGVHSYIRKLMKIPQAWEVDEAKRRILMRKAKERKLQGGLGINVDNAATEMGGNNDIIQEIADTFIPDASMQAAEGDLFHGISTINDYDGKATEETTCVLSEEQMREVEPFNEMPNIIVSGSDDVGPAVHDQMVDIYESYKTIGDIENMKNRADPNRLADTLNIGSSLKEKLFILKKIQKIFTSIPPGMDPDSFWMQSDSDNCKNLWEDHLGCHGLVYMSTDWSSMVYEYHHESAGMHYDPPPPPFDDGLNRPHNKCQKKAVNLLQKYTGNKKPMRKALARALLQMGDFDTWNDGDSSKQSWRNFLNNGDKMTPGVVGKTRAADGTTWSTKTCKMLWNGYRADPDNDYAGFGPYKAKNYALQAAKGSDADSINSKQFDIQQILKTSTTDSNAYKPTGTNDAAGAQADWMTECTSMVKFLYEQTPISGQYKNNGVDVTYTDFTISQETDGEELPNAKFWVSSWNAENFRSALLMMLDTHYIQQWEANENSLGNTIKPAATRFARCLMKGIRENKQEAFVEQKLSKIANGQEDIVTLADEFTQPAYDAMINEYKYNHMDEDDTTNDAIPNTIDTGKSTLKSEYFEELCPDAAAAKDEAKHLSEQCQQFCSDMDAYEQMADLPQSSKAAKPVFTDTEYPGAGQAAEEFEERSGYSKDKACEVDVQCKLFNAFVGAGEKQMLDDNRQHRMRLRERRRNRQLIEKRRALREEEEKKKKEEKKRQRRALMSSNNNNNNNQCMTINGDKYCKEGTTTDNNMSMLEEPEETEEEAIQRHLEEHAREIQEWWEERGIKHIKLSRKQSRGSNRSRRMSRDQLRKKRLARKRLLGRR